MNSITNKTAWYQKQVADYQEQSLAYQKKSNHLSVLRLVVFLVFSALLVLSVYFRSATASAAILILFAAVFGKLIQNHNRVKAQKKHYDLLVQMNEDEIDRLQLKLGKFVKGNEFIDQEHPFCLDLDLFGPHSLFQFLNRTATSGGAALLAKKMLYPDPVTSIYEQQQAVKELSEHPEWCQNFIASGLAHKSQTADTSALLRWVNNKVVYPGWFKIALAVMPLFAIMTSVLYLLGILPGYPALIMLLFNGSLLYKIKPMIEEVYQETSKSINTLRAYEAMIRRIEDSEFDCQVLSGLRNSFVDRSERASLTIKELKNILSRIETRENGFYFLLDAYLLLDIIWLLQAERWKSLHSTYVNTWFETISTFEMQVSLGLAAYNQDQYSFPRFVPTKYTFSCKNLGHPLIPLAERVTNDFNLEDQGMVVVLTGSNMSGKSTFLRTIGVNIVLARLGAPVCATDMELGNFNLFTSMRTTDSLEQHVSSFYAELERIRQLIQMIEKGTPTLFLLDELLKGTNSVDRNAGSTALIKQLGKGPSFGLISTHDLALGKLSEEFENIVNYSFNSELKNGKLLFDYKLRAGLSQSFNASELMTQMGIEMENNHHNS